MEINKDAIAYADIFTKTLRYCSNLDNYENTGIYYYNNNTTGTKPNNVGGGKLFCIQLQNMDVSNSYQNYQYQIAIPNYTAQMFSRYRYYYNGSYQWSGWIKMGSLYIPTANNSGISGTTNDDSVIISSISSSTPVTGAWTDIMANNTSCLVFPYVAPSLNKWCFKIINAQTFANAGKNLTGKIYYSYLI